MSLPYRTAGPGGARRCPRCADDEARLAAEEVAETPLAECARCGGLWLDQAALDRVLVEIGPQQAVLSLPVSVAAPQAVAYLRCPECSSLMERRNFGRRSGVIVDLCPVHGVWFDHGELQRVVRFVQDKGLPAHPLSSPAPPRPAPPRPLRMAWEGRSYRSWTDLLADFLHFRR